MNPQSANPEEGSKLHWLFLPGAERSDAKYDTILEETPNFVVLPTKGSIVRGWVLVVPKFPISRMADVPESLRGELDEVVEATLEKLEDRFGSAFSFEHGGFKGSQVSCGVDQAHLHIASLDFDLLKSAEAASQGGWVEVNQSRALADGVVDQEYWFASSEKRTIYKPVDFPVSQFFRKIVADHMHEREAWDYKAHDFLENVDLTIRAFAAHG